MSTITFSMEAVASVLLGAEFTAYDWDEGSPGFTVWAVGGIAPINVRLFGYSPGNGLRALLGEYERVLDQAGYVVRSTGSEVVVTGVED